MNEYARRLFALNEKIGAISLDAFVISDPDSIYYFTGCENYIGMDFGRPSVLFVPKDDEAVLIVPAGDLGMIEAMARSVRVLGWRDSAGGEWRTLLKDLLAGKPIRNLGFETQFNPLVHTQIRSISDANFVVSDRLIEELRLIKSPAEIADLRKAGQVADAMMAATRDTIAFGVPEYVVSLAAIDAGTRRAASLLAEEGAHPLCSPMVNYLQIMKSGTNTDLGHCRPGLKCVSEGEPVAVCLCGMINYKHMKLAMDRPFFVGSISREHEFMTRVAQESQQAALDALRPGNPVSAVHEAASAVLQKHGYAPCTRTGRGPGRLLQRETADHER